MKLNILCLYYDIMNLYGDTGNLKVQVFTAYGAIPIQNTNIVVYKDIEEYRVVFFQGVTDISGIISDIKLPAPMMVTSNEETPIYTIYNMTAFNAGYESLKTYNEFIYLEKLLKMLSILFS